jgi:3-deoxy-D-manno-octulosonic-acid transferase
VKTWFYSWIVYPLVLALAWTWGRFNPKMRRTLRLRAWKSHLSLRFRAGITMEYWIHVASVGELEYAIPIIEDLQRRGKGVLVSY